MVREETPHPFTENALMPTKKGAKSAVVSTTSKKGTVQLVSRDGTPFLDDSKLTATIQDDENSLPASNFPNVKLKTAKNKLRLVISFKVNLLPSFLTFLDKRSGGTGLLGDGLLTITLTDSSAAMATAIAIAKAIEDNTTNIVTITTSANHGFSTGQLVLIQNVPTAGYNGTFYVTVTSNTTFTYTNPTGGLADDTSGSGTATLQQDLPVQKDVPVDYIDDPIQS
jgi:hypothetical protein